MCGLADDHKLVRYGILYEGLVEQALADGAPNAAAGVLVDEEFGADILRRAKAAGLTVALPVERSGQDEFDFAYGDDFADHIGDFAPDFVNVLARYNPDDDLGGNARQAARLAYLSAWLRRHEHALLFGLLVSPTETHLARVDGDVAAYEHQKLPDLVIVAVSALQAANVEPDVWKLQVSTIGPTASGPWLRRGPGPRRCRLHRVGSRRRRRPGTAPARRGSRRGRLRRLCCRSHRLVQRPGRPWRPGAAPEQRRGPGSPGSTGR